MCCVSIERVHVRKRFLPSLEKSEASTTLVPWFGTASTGISWLEQRDGRALQDATVPTRAWESDVTHQGACGLVLLTMRTHVSASVSVSQPGTPSLDHHDGVV